MYTVSNNINTKLVVIVLCVIILIVVGSYFFNFDLKLLINGDRQGFLYNLSDNNTDWGTFGDYIGGILNPVIAAFAFYLIAKTYELQKIELESTRKLLEVSTNAQKDQINLAALTALVNSNLTRIQLLKLKQNLFLNDILESGKKTDLIQLPFDTDSVENILAKAKEIFINEKPRIQSLVENYIKIEYETKKMNDENVVYEKQIKDYCNETEPRRGSSH